ncbi:hypothetical protein [Nocardia sp. NPDC051570]|uniref:hypothetical protein n=1 Tax=Nocardia sp. NPDC051570 TaxID=3364324 RepID=UPI0037B4CCF1
MGTYEYFETTTNGCFPAGTDIAQVLADGDERELFAVWNTYFHNELTRKGLAHADTAGREALQNDLTQHAEVTAVQALEANRRLVRMLTGRRWMTMRDAREAGDSWTTIGAALGVSKQGAVDWYKRKIADQEKYVGDFHDSDRARAVVTE